MFKKKEKRMFKKLYRKVFIVLGFIVNTYIGFQVCPQLVSYDRDLVVWLGIFIFIALVCPMYVILINLILRGKKS
jgi:4-amino-4-deoxy-L-arabinose transferase-like glycosyltransferase